MTEAGRIAHQLRLWARSRPIETRRAISIITAQLALAARYPIARRVIMRSLAEIGRRQ
jgi:hypothetical protein